MYGIKKPEYFFVNSANTDESVDVFIPHNDRTKVKHPTPVIFIHDMMCTKEIWNVIAQEVANRMERLVYTYDTACHGTQIDEREYSYIAIFRDLGRVLHELDIQKVILVGHGIGGKAAIHSALEQPDRIAALFVVEMHVEKIPVELIKRSIAFAEEWKTCVKVLPPNTSVDDVTRLSIDEVFRRLYPKGQENDAEIQSYRDSKIIYKQLENGKYDVSYNADAIRQGLQSYLENYEIDESDHSGIYSGPAFFFFGSNSPYNVEEQEEELGSYFPSLEMIIYENGPHRLFVREPLRFAIDICNRITARQI